MGEPLPSPNHQLPLRPDEERPLEYDEGERGHHPQRFQVLPQDEHDRRSPEVDLEARKHQQLRLRCGQQEEAGQLQRGAHQERRAAEEGAGVHQGKPQEPGATERSR